MNLQANLLLQCNGNAIIRITWNADSYMYDLDFYKINVDDQIFMHVENTSAIVELAIPLPDRTNVSVQVRSVSKCGQESAIAWASVTVPSSTGSMDSTTAVTTDPTDVNIDCNATADMSVSGTSSVYSYSSKKIVIINGVTVLLIYTCKQFHFLLVNCKYHVIVLNIITWCFNNNDLDHLGKFFL